MKRTSFAILCAFGLLAARAGEGHGHDGEACGRGVDHGHDGEACGRGVEVGEAAAELIGLKTARVERRRISSAVGFYGRVTPDPRARRNVALPLAGFVSWRIGAPCEIRPGDELLRLVSPDAAAARGELATLEARMAAVRRAGARNAALAAELAAKRIAYAAMTNALEAVDAERGEFALRSTARGRADELLVANGAFADRGTDVLRMTEARPPALFALVPFGDARNLADGAVARAGDASGAVRLDRTRDDGLVGVWVTFGEGDAVAQTPGESAYLVCETDAGEAPVACVPSAAVFRDGVTPSVFVRDEHDADRFVARPVKAGRSAAGWTEVSGLGDGDEVVVQGVYELRQALPSPGGGKRVAGHFHADGKFHADGEDGE